VSGERFVAPFPTAGEFFAQPGGEQHSFLLALELDFGGHEPFQGTVVHVHFPDMALVAHQVPGFPQVGHIGQFQQLEGVLARNLVLELRTGHP